MKALEGDIYERRQTGKTTAACTDRGPRHRLAEKGPMAPDNERLGFRCGENPSSRFERFGKGRVARDKLAAGDGSSDMTAQSPRELGREE